MKNKNSKLRMVSSNRHVSKVGDGECFKSAKSSKRFQNHPQVQTDSSGKITSKQSQSSPKDGWLVDCGQSPYPANHSPVTCSAYLLGFPVSCGWILKRKDLGGKN